MKYIKYVITVTALVLTSNVNAALISVDWLSVGDNSITRDNTSGLDWLDLTATTSISYDTVLAEQVAGGQFDGWRYATTDEVSTMFLSNFGIDLYNGNTSFGPPPAGLAQATGFFGDTIIGIGPQFTGIAGRTSDVNVFNNAHLVVGADYNSSTSTFFRRIDPNLNTHYSSDISINEFTGSWLVSDGAWEPSAVPVPAAVWLFGSGLLGLIGVAHRKGRA